MDQDLSVISKNSRQHINNGAETSIISNFDNWRENVSQEDSNIFAENFAEIKISKTKKEVKKPPKTLKSKDIAHELSSYQKSKAIAKQKTEAETTNSSNTQAAISSALKLNLNSEAYVPNTKVKKQDNCEVTLPKAELSNKPKHLALDDQEDYLNDIDESEVCGNVEDDNLKKTPDIYVKEYKDQNALFNNKLRLEALGNNLHNYSNSFVHTNNQFKFNTCPDEELKKVQYQQYKYSFTESKTQDTQLNFPGITKSNGFPNLFDNSTLQNTTISSAIPYYNNYGSNNSTAVTNISDQFFSVTPKHQKFTSDHNVNVKLTTNNQLGSFNPYNAINFSEEKELNQDFKSKK